jgi:hypothetical protein
MDARRSEEDTVGMKQWLARILGGRPAPSRPAAAPALQVQQVLEINVRNAIEAHQAWKRRLEAAIRSGSAFESDPRLVGRDDVCPLGRWIHGAGGRQFGAEPKFLDLKAKHAAFHQCAGRALSLARAGDDGEALQEMSSSSDFANLSWEVVGDLASIFSRHEGAHA